MLKIAERRKAKKAAGECYLCAEPAGAGIVHCAFHQNQNRLASIKRRNNRKVVGKCVNCNEPAILGKTRCAFHQEKHRAYVHKISIKRKEAKICVKNKNHKQPTDGHVLCDDCLKRMREKHRVEEQG